jgi:hypothetical protein
VAKFVEIRDYWISLGHVQAARDYRVILTGGEALLYKSRTEGGSARLLEVIEAVRRILPSARIIVKTGGFRPASKFQHKLFNQVSEEFKYPLLEWRFGWNLYQDAPERALNRFVHTILSILSHQKFVAIDTIYDKTNVEDTCQTMEQGLRLIGANLVPGTLLEFVQVDPNKHRRIEIEISDYSIIMDLGPSYAPNKASAVHEFYAEPASNCETIANGVSRLYYDVDMGLIHCNDSFVDARVPSLHRQGHPIADDLAFLNDRFASLKRFITRSNISFDTRKDRCFFCTKFVMTDPLRLGPEAGSCGVADMRTETA